MNSLESYHNFNKNVLDIFNEMKITMQSPIHHAEGDVYTHTQMVVAEVEKILSKYSERSKKLLLYTALFHDIAKPETTEVIYNKRVKDWISPGHAKLGEKMFRELMWNDFSFEDREEIAKLIRYHGLPMWFEDKEDPDMSVIKASLLCNLNELITFAQCDFRGRVCGDLEGCLFQMELFKERAENLNCLNNPYQFTSDWARLHYLKNGGYPGKEIWEPEGDWVTIMCGLPGSGKNTWIEKNYDGPIIELDTIRKKHKIKWDDRDAQGFVYQEAKEELKINLRKKHRILWNGTNMTDLQRKTISDLATDYNAKVRIVYIDCSVEQAIIQNRKREEGKQVKQEVIERYSRKMDIPSIIECHELLVIK